MPPQSPHRGDHQIFFQVFDKGRMEDGEGRMIDFKNTIILLTSNVGTDLIMNMCKDPELMPAADGLTKGLREPLLKAFPAALPMPRFHIGLENGDFAHHFDEAADVEQARGVTQAETR